MCVVWPLGRVAEGHARVRRAVARLDDCGPVSLGRSVAAVCVWGYPSSAGGQWSRVPAKSVSVRTLVLSALFLVVVVVVVVAAPNVQQSRSLLCLSLWS